LNKRNKVLNERKERNIHAYPVCKTEPVIIEMNEIHKTDGY